MRPNEDTSFFISYTLFWKHSLDPDQVASDEAMMNPHITEKEYFLIFCYKPAWFYN